jgi:hypothetical protein
MLKHKKVWREARGIRDEKRKGSGDHEGRIH